MIEINIDTIKILSESKELPMLFWRTRLSRVRLKYRFLDLRREEMHRNIILRSKVLFIMVRMLKLGFWNIKPDFNFTSPEGARDLVPMDQIQVNFTPYLAPQQFKQLIMVSVLINIFKSPHVLETKMLELIEAQENFIN